MRVQTLKTILCGVWSLGSPRESSQRTTISQFPAPQPVVVLVLAQSTSRALVLSAFSGGGRPKAQKSFCQRMVGVPAQVIPGIVACKPDLPRTAAGSARIRSIRSYDAWMATVRDLALSFAFSAESCRPAMPSRPTVSTMTATRISASEKPRQETGFRGGDASRRTARPADDSGNGGRRIAGGASPLQMAWPIGIALSRSVGDWNPAIEPVPSLRRVSQIRWWWWRNPTNLGKVQMGGRAFALEQIGAAGGDHFDVLAGGGREGLQWMGRLA